MTSIYVYEDYIHNNGVLLRRLQADFGTGAVRLIDAADIKSGILRTEPPALCIMPGGADLYFCEKLDGIGNREIRRYVEAGGTYLGICAGAYYGCAAIEWGIGTGQEITGPRELAFFEGSASGPVTKFIENGDIDKSWKAPVEIGIDDIITYMTYYAGPVFSEPVPHSPAKVLARYTQLPGTPPAILQCRAGSGQAVLCSPHPEYDGQAFLSSLNAHLNESWHYEQEVGKVLQKHVAGQRKIWHALMRICLGENNFTNAA